ncbi:hypothetical protein ACFQZT_16750 [Paenibacillus sp. GCM10027628]|uniref:hypothetical protein n=1 Tax=Paenibacillus sp. GCM10027628 TaxID=3273413 RepID=UPI00363FE36A
MLDETQALQSLLKKAAVWKFLHNLDRELYASGMNNAKISKLVGNAENSFNKALNKVKDLRISTVLRILAYTNRELGFKGQQLISLDRLFDAEIQQMLLTAGDLSGEEQPVYNDEIRQLFIGLQALQSSGLQKALNRAELEAYLRLKNEWILQEETHE